MSVISRYLGMFSLDNCFDVFKEGHKESYFPLSWDVLIRFLNHALYLVYTQVISRYLGMFSLDDIRGIQYTCNVSVISRYLGMFSLDIISECFRQTFFSYFPLSWDVLIRLTTWSENVDDYMVISRYLGMFSLDPW